MTTADMPVDAPRRLTRSRDGRIVAGVCSGAASYFDIDPVILRIILVGLSVFGGAGIVIYALAWVLIPEAGHPTTKLEHWLRGRHADRRRDAVLIGAIFVVLLFMLRRNPFAVRISGALVTIALAMLVAAVVGRHRESAGAPVGTWSTQPEGPPADPTASWSFVPRQPRPHSWLGWLTFGSALLVAGVFSIVGLSGLAHPQPADVLAATVAVVGIGLAIGAIFGRAWLMIPIGLLLVGLLAAADAVPRDLTWSAGNRTWTPISVNVASPYVLGAGDATLNLANLRGAQDATIDSRVGAGRLVVLVPRGTAVSVDARTSAGRILMFGRESDGTGLHSASSASGTSSAAGTLTIDLQMGYGDVEVRDAPA
jgi:phage shock protein PspC (stress-responsive transcriptional regulator)